MYCNVEDTNMPYKFSMQDYMDAAAKKVGIDGWIGDVWEEANGGKLVYGCVPDGIYLNGTGKGKPRMNNPIKGTECRIFISTNELIAKYYKSNMSI